MALLSRRSSRLCRPDRFIRSAPPPRGSRRWISKTGRPAPPHSSSPLIEAVARAIPWSGMDGPRTARVVSFEAPCRGHAGGRGQKACVGAFIPALKGCMWYSSLDIAFALVVPASGAATIPLPIPADPSAAGFKTYDQCLVFPAVGKYQSSNGFVFTILP